MGVVAAQHVAHAGGRLLEGLVRGQIILIHGVEDAPVDRLQAVPHVGQRPAHDDAHGVLDVALLHLVHQIGGLYLLVWKPDSSGSYCGFLLMYLPHNLRDRVVHGGRPQGPPPQIAGGRFAVPGDFSFVGADAFIRPFLLPGRHRNVRPMWASAPTIRVPATLSVPQSLNSPG